MIPPGRIETSRLVVRICQPTEAHLLRAAIDMSLEHLRAWLPWAMTEPSTLADTRDRLTRQAALFRTGDDFQYAIFDSAEMEILGGIGLHRRAGPRCLEIGYWIRADQLGRGLATEAARAVSIVALGLPDVDCVQIDCDPRNLRSKRVPEKLGFELVERRESDKSTPEGESRDTLVYRHTSAQGLLGKGVP